MASLNILIIGAGPGGLATASFLALKGHKVQVLEQNPEIRTEGGCLQCPPNAKRLLIALGLEQKLKEVSLVFNQIKIYRYEGLEDIATYGNQAWMTRRIDLSRLLFERARELGVKVHFNKAVTEIDEKKPEVTTRDGSTFAADLVVAADGIKSMARQIVNQGQQIPPKVTEECCFQATVPAKDMLKDPQTAQMYNRGGPTGIMGPGKMIICWPMPAQEEFQLILADMRFGVPPKAEVSNRAAMVEDVKSLFKAFHPAVQKVLSCATECTKWQIAELPTGVQWVGSNGKLVLLGDAVHSMVPHTAQGFTQSIEDGAALAEFLTPVSSANGQSIADQLPHICRRWADFRRPRTEAMQQKAQINANVFTIDDGPAQKARDEGMRAAGNAPPPNFEEIEADMTAPVNDPRHMKWMLGYDVVAEAKNAIAAI